jgi:arylsulfatase A-like enzyme
MRRIEDARRTTASMKRTPFRGGILLVVGVVFAGCHGGEPVWEEIAIRLDGRSFEDTASAPVPIVDIGGEARPVPYARRVYPLPVVRTSPAHSGRVRAVVAMPKEVIAWPRSAFAVDVKVDFGSSAPAVDRIAPSTFGLGALRLHEGWRLRIDRQAPELGKLVVDLPTAQDGVRSLVQLVATTPMPRQMTSRRFDLPSGSTLSLRHGLADRTDPAAPMRVCFRATLDCPWWWKRDLVSDCLAVGDPRGKGWHRTDVPFPWGGRGCVLTLATDGSAEGDPLWAVPVVRAPALVDPVERPNVVLVSLDTLRADHLGGYGYRRATSPSLDELVIRNGTAFDMAMSTFPMTHIAHLSIFTGLFAAALPTDGVLPAAAATPTLTELLRDAGFTTIAVTEDALVSKEYGFGRGFDHLVELHPAWSDRARLVFARGKEFLRAMRDRRFFLFLHNYKVHSPYLPSPGYSTLFLTDDPDAAPLPDVPSQFRQARDAYDQSIRELDDQLASFLQTLDAEGLADRTLLVVLSDHGEAFGEHGTSGHGFSPDQEALHVPLVFRGPGVVRRRVETPVSLADVAPTILDVLGLAVPSSMQGRSLRAALVGDPIEPRPVFFGWNAVRARGVLFGHVKLVRTGDRAWLYNLASDPGEVGPVNVRARLPPLLAQTLDNHQREGARRRAILEVAADAPPMSPELDRSLRALGYVQ